jgi:hypothetical protein
MDRGTVACLEERDLFPFSHFYYRIIPQKRENIGQVRGYLTGKQKKINK